jgi:hypothetical protein
LFVQEQCIKLLAGDQNSWGTPIATYESHWYLDKREYSDVIAKKRYKRLVIEDLEGCRLSKLKAMTAIQIGDDIYTFHGKDSFVGAVPSYEFKLLHAGVRI